MVAQIWPDRVDIFNAHLPSQTWESLLDDLKAEHVPAFTPTGKRLAASVSSTGEIRTTIYRTSEMPDEEIRSVLKKYGISVREKT